MHINTSIRLIRSRRGLSLIETVIALGILGFVMTGLWVAASAVSSKSALDATIADMMQLTQNIRSLYSNQATFIGVASGTDISTRMIKAQVVPTTLVNPTSGADLRTRWNTPIIIAVGDPTDRFDIVFQNTLPTDACVMLAGMAAGTVRDKGLIEITAGAESYTGAALRDLTATMIPPCTNVTFTFNLKG